MWIKNLRQRKLQTVLIFLIIAICTTLLAGAMSILTSLEKPSREFAEACRAVSAKVYCFTRDEDKIYATGDQFSKLPNVKKVEYLKYHAINENLLLNDKKVELFVNLTEYNDSIFGTSIYLEGDRTTAKSLADNECILPVCISNEYNIHIGDTVTLKLADRDLMYQVAGVYTDPYQTSTAYDSDILIEKLPAAIKYHISINVFGKDHATGKQIEATYRETYDKVFNGFIFTLEDRISNGLIVGRIIGAMFLAVGVIMLLVSGLLLYYMIKNAMIADEKSIAIYKTVGYTSNDILIMYLKFYFMVVTLACFIGIICSVFISNTLLTSIYENMGQLKVHNSLLSGMICYLVIVSFIILLITMIINKTKRIRPIHSLNGADYGGIKKKRNYKGNSKLQFSALGIAYRTFIRDKRNALSIVITSIVTIFSINFIVISLDVANTMKENNDFWVGVDKSDVMVNVANANEYDCVKSILEQDARTDDCLNSNFDARVAMKWKKGMTSSTMTAFVYDNYNTAKLPVTEGRNPNAANEIAISTLMAEELHKSVGDYIEIYLSEDKKANMLITGFFQSYMQFGRVSRLTTSTYHKNHLEIQYNNISVYLKNSKDINQFIRDMKNKVGGKGKVIRRTDQFISIMNMIAVPQQKALPPVATLIMLIAGINIFSIVFLKNLKAYKINGIYKCIGYTSWHLILSNLCYVLTLAFVSIAITFPISLLTYAPIMKLSLSMFHFTEYPVQYNTSHLAIANAVVIIIFIVSTLISSKLLFKVSARDLIQE